MKFGQRSVVAGGVVLFHGMPFAPYNLLIGSLADRLVLNDPWKRRCANAALLPLLMPAGIVLKGALADRTAS